MRGRDEFFSVYGNGEDYAEQRREGFNLFRTSTPKTVTKAAWTLVGILLAGGIALVAQSAVPQAHAGAQFVLHHLSR